ncbi:MAG: penicillin-binding protein 2 [Acidimicrobiia bacterium]
MAEPFRVGPASARRRPAAIRVPRARLEKRSKQRLVALLLAMLLAFAGVAVRLVDLQVVSRDHYLQLGLDQRVRRVQLPAERGSIFDRNGNDLAVSVPAKTVWADPRLVGNAKRAADELAPVLGLDAKDLRHRLAQRDRAFVYLARKVDDTTAAKVAGLRLPGVNFLSESKRNYPAGSVAAPLVGFTGIDNNGLGGLETAQESALSGTPGEVVLERDPRGREIPTGKRRFTPSRRGQDLVLTVDESLQYETERVLTEEVGATGAKRGTAIVVDVRTGDILAMVSVDGPSNGQPAHPAVATEPNRAVTDVYEPGSTNKAITVAGAIEDGLVGPTTLFQVPYSLQIADKVFKDHDPHPVMPWTTADILRESSNVGAILIGAKLGKDRLDHYLRAFGFGAETGLRLPGETQGLLPPTYKYSGTSMGTIPIGQGLAVTALQMVEVYATIAAGGVMHAPRIIAATVDAKGTRHDRPFGASRRVVSERTAALMNDMLQGVVQNGTGKLASVPGYSVAGKTGTANKAPYSAGQYVASFAGFVPAQAPRLAAIAVLDTPQTNIYGGTVAAPAFARMMQYALRLEKIPPTDPAASGVPIKSPGLTAAAMAARPPTTTAPATAAPGTATTAAPTAAPGTATTAAPTAAPTGTTPAPATSAPATSAPAAPAPAPAPAGAPPGPAPPAKPPSG